MPLRVVSSTLGRPLAIRDEEIDVSLPSHLDDNDITSSRPIQVPVGPNETQQLSPFLHVIRIRRISGQILSTFYNSRKQTRALTEEKKAVRRRLHEEIVAWKQETRRLCLDQATAGQAHVSSFQSEEWYEAVYNNAMLLLYRPSPYFPHPTIAPGPNNEEGELLRLLKASTSSIESYAALHQKRRLNYSWITLHGVFLAGLAYIYSVGRILHDPAQRCQLPDILNIIEVTRGCSNLFVAICERWNVSRRSCELFNKLSNAVIKDCLNATCKPQGNVPPRTTGNTADGEIRVASVGLQELDPQLVAPPAYSVAGEGSAPNLPPPLDDILVMDEFRHYSLFFDLANQNKGPFPSELVAGFSQEWLFESPFDAQGGFDAPMHDNAVSGEVEAEAPAS